MNSMNSTNSTNSMNGQRVRKGRFWSAWNYRKEEEWLTKQSARGLHLVQPYVWRQEFERNDSVKYAYRLDFQQNTRDRAEFGNYVQMFADDGWEYIGTVSGMWHYFRKLDTGEGVYELYTDRSSLKAFYTRIQRMLGVIALANLAIFAFNATNLISRYSGKQAWTITVPVLAIYGALIALLFYGFARMTVLARRTETE